MHFDPNSPAGKEYALPLDQAREEATGQKGSSEEAGGVPLFGSGISERPPRPPGASPDRQAGNTGERGGRAGDQVKAGGADRADPAIEPQSGSGYPLASGAALVLGFVLLGGVLAFGLRAMGPPKRA